MNTWVGASYMVYMVRQPTVVCGEVQVVFLLWKCLKNKVSSRSSRVIFPFPAIFLINVLI